MLALAGRVKSAHKAPPAVAGQRLAAVADVGRCPRPKPRTKGRSTIDMAIDGMDQSCPGHAHEHHSLAPEMSRGSECERLYARQAAAGIARTRDARRSRPVAAEPLGRSRAGDGQDPWSSGRLSHDNGVGARDGAAGRRGSTSRTQPAATAFTTWTANAPVTPIHTHRARWRVPRTSKANSDLSGSSATKITPNVAAASHRRTRRQVPARVWIAS